VRRGVQGFPDKPVSAADNLGPAQNGQIGNMQVPAEDSQVPDGKSARTIREVLASRLRRGLERVSVFCVNIVKAGGGPLRGFISNSWESIVVLGILLIVFTVELNAVFHGGAQGQDFYYHRKRMLEAAKDPVKYIGSITAADPPLYHLCAGIVYRITGPKRWLHAVGIMNVVLNVGALFLLYLISRFLIQKKILRICALCFVGFLPAFAITSVVFSADAFSQLPCLLALYVAALAIFDRIAPRNALLVCTMATVFAISAKFTAISLLAAFCGGITLMFLSRRLSFKMAMKCLILYLCVTVPIALIYLYRRPYRPELYVSTAGPERLGLPGAKIQPRSAVFFRGGDLEFLDAPSHWQLARNPKNHSPSFANSNRYSYPGLLCLGIFTDVLNCFQSKNGLNPEPSEPWTGGALIGKRSDVNQDRMVIAVRSGSVFFLCILFTLPFFFVDSVRAVFQERSREHLLWLLAFLLGAAWLGFMICILPWVTGPYMAGYWLPRLVLPSIMIFGMLFFAGIDRLDFFRRNLVGGILLSLVTIQSLIQLSFLWMSG
jgi:hypothetical protein